MTVECISCKDDPLTGFYLNSSQSTKLTFRSKWHVYPRANPKEKREQRDMFHMVGPVGLYRIRCVQENNDPAFITEDQMEHHERWLFYRYHSFFKTKVQSHYIDGLLAHKVRQ